MWDSMACWHVLRAQVGGDERQYGLFDRNDIIYQPGATDERGVAEELLAVPTTRPLARQVVLLVRAMGTVVPQPWASVVVAFVDLLVETPDCWCKRRKRRTFAFI